MQRGQLLVDYQKYQGHYNDISQHIIHQPNQDRKCTDAGCIAMFFVILVAFVGIGFLQISEYNSLEPINNRIGEGEGRRGMGRYGANADGELYITEHIGIIAAGVGTSIAIAYIYVLLLKTFPRPMVYFMIVVSMGVIAGLSLVGLFSGNLGLFIGMGITFLIYALLLCCLWKKINTGIAMVSVSTKFLSQKPSVFLTPIVKLILTFMVGAFYAYSLSAMIAIVNHKNQMQQDTGKQAGFISLFVLFWLFFLFLFYYMMTYTISVVCANWYYGIQGSKGSLLTAYKWMAKQFGSLVFGALIIAVITFARMAVEGKKRETKNVAAAVCLCLLACILKAIEDLVKVLNHYCVIVLTITGEDYISGAKTTMGLLWKQLGLMSITNLICNFLVLWGLIITVGLPCLLSFILISAKTSSSQQQSSVVVIVAICSMLISTVVFQIIVQSVSCIFIYYSLDKSFIERGLINAQRFPQETTLMINRYSNNPYMMDGGPGSQEGYDRMKN